MWEKGAHFHYFNGDIITMNHKKPTLLECIMIFLGTLLLLASLLMGIHSYTIKEELDSLSGYEEYLQQQISDR